MGLTALPFLTHSQKVACLNALSPDFHALHYSLNRVVEDSPGKLSFNIPLLSSWVLLWFVFHSAEIPERKVEKMKLFCPRFLLTIHWVFCRVIHGTAFTAEVVDLFLEIISRH